MGNGTGHRPSLCPGVTSLVIERENLTDGEISARLELALRRMSRRRREIFLAIHLGNEPYAAIAELTGLGVVQVERHVAPAFEELHVAIYRKEPVRLWRRLIRWLAAIGRR